MRALALPDNLPHLQHQPVGSALHTEEKVPNGNKKAYGSQKMFGRLVVWEIGTAFQDPVRPLNISHYSLHSTLKLPLF